VHTAFTELIGVEHPLVQAPMAGGPTTVELVAAVSDAGALGSLPGTGLPPEDLRAAIRRVQSLTSRPFAVNLLVPSPPPPLDPEVAERVRRLLAPYRRELGLDDPAPPAPPPWSLEDQLTVIAEEHVAVFSFAFGIPPLAPLADTILLGTANTVEEAQALEQAGVHVIVAQGAEAGGHRGTFIGSFEDGLVPLRELVLGAAEAVSVPIVAAGGLMDGADVARVLAKGAAAAQLGTAFLFTPESGASQAWRDAVRTGETIVTAAYTGRPARAARTPFLETLGTVEPAPFPFQRALVGDFLELDGYGFYLGGTGGPRARDLPAAELVRKLAQELEAAAA
jgi:nitronate monooxygenase